MQQKKLNFANSRFRMKNMKSKPLSLYIKKEPRA